MNDDDRQVSAPDLKLRPSKSKTVMRLPDDKVPHKLFKL